MKWHFCILILFFTFLGILSHNEVSVPNQEIVLQFKGVEVTSNEAQNTIDIVKSHLQDLGADNIHVKNSGNGKLKITYHSDADVDCVRESLSKEKKISFGYILDNKSDQNSIPSDDKGICYNFDIYEIQKGTDADLDLNGIVLKEKTSHDRFYDPNVIFAYNRTDVKIENRIFKVLYDSWRINLRTLEVSLYSIPEVRAGPQFVGNS